MHAWHNYSDIAVCPDNALHIWGASCWMWGSKEQLRLDARSNPSTDHVLKTNQILLAQLSSYVKNVKWRSPSSHSNLRGVSLNLYFCKHVNIQSCIFTLLTLYTKHYIQDTFLFLSSPSSAHLMMVCKTTSFTSMPITQSNAASRPTAFFKVKI